MHDHALVGLVVRYDSKGRVAFLGVATDIMIYSQYVFISATSRACKLDSERQIYL